MSAYFPPNFKPMLAGKVQDPKALKFPVTASPKLDGVRAFVKDAQVVSRNMKLIPNKNVQALFGRDLLEAFDGELVVGDPVSPSCFNTTSSCTSRENGKCDVVFYVFDIVNSSMPYAQRIKELEKRIAALPPLLKNVVKAVATFECANVDELMKTEDKMVEMGFEGCMTRRPNGAYKFGRSTDKEELLLKLKRFEDSEAEIIGFEEEMHNGNAAGTDAFGRTERSSHKENMTGKKALGAFVVRDVNTGVEFKIGTGFDLSQRAKFWILRDKIKGQIVKYKFQPVGSMEKPRFPVFLGFRAEWDMSK